MAFVVLLGFFPGTKPIEWTHTTKEIIGLHCIALYRLRSPTMSVYYPSTPPHTGESENQYTLSPRGWFAEGLEDSWRAAGLWTLEGWYVRAAALWGNPKKWPLRPSLPVKMSIRLTWRVHVSVGGTTGEADLSLEQWASLNKCIMSLFLWRNGISYSVSSFPSLMMKVQCRKRDVRKMYQL